MAGPLAWRIGWQQTPPPGAIPLISLTIDQAVAAYAEPLDPAELLTERAPGGVGGLDVLFLPAGSATPFDLQTLGAAWIASRKGNPDWVEIGYRDLRVTWQPGRALLTGPDDHLDPALAALAAFSIWQGARRQLTDDLDEAWRTARLDVDLAHAPRPSGLARQEHVNRMTRRAVRMRMRFIDLQSAQDPELELTGVTRRLFNELLMATQARDRLAVVDDKIEVLEDLYATANERLTSFAYFRREYWLEIAIVVLLLVQFAQMVIDFFSD